LLPATIYEPQAKLYWGGVYFSRLIIHKSPKNPTPN